MPTLIHRNWLPWAGKSRQPHLPKYHNFTLLGVAEFECLNDEEGLLQFLVPVYRHDLFYELLCDARVPMDSRGESPRCRSHAACEFVRLPPLDHDGKFISRRQCGSRVQEDEAHIAQPYLIARTPLVEAIQNPETTDHDPLFPVTLNHVAATSFAANLGLRLPSELEWEYACRGGSSTRYCFGNHHRRLRDFAWHHDNAEGYPQSVARLQANAFGLFEIHGNVFEWCRDTFDETPRVPEDLDGRPAGEPVTDPYPAWDPPAHYGNWPPPDPTSASPGSGRSGQDAARAASNTAPPTGDLPATHSLPVYSPASASRSRSALLPRMPFSMPDGRTQEAFLRLMDNLANTMQIPTGFPAFLREHELLRGARLAFSTQLPVTP